MPTKHFPPLNPLTLFGLGILMLLSCEPPKTKVMPSEKSGRIIEWMNQAGVTGMQLGFFDQQHEYVWCGGYRNLEDSLEVTTETVFEAGALGEQVVTALAFRLQDANLIDLAEPVGRYFRHEQLAAEPEYAKITGYHLLAHTSGVSGWSADELSLAFEPGTSHGYSPMGYGILAKVMEEKLGESFPDLVEQWVFEPLQMNRSAFVWQPEYEKNAARGHSIIGITNALRKRTEANPAVSLYTTAEDYLALMKALMSGSFLSEASRNKLFSEAAEIQDWEGKDTHLARAHGIGIEKHDDGANLYWQWGDNFTFRGFMMMNREADAGLVYLTNSSNGLYVLQNILNEFFNGHMWCVEWLGYDHFNNPDRSTTIALEKAFYFSSPAEAGEVYEERCEADSHAVRANFNNVVWSLFEKKSLNSAENLIEIHLKHFPNDAQAYIRRGEALGFRHDYRGSWLSYQKAMEIDPSTARTILPRFPWYQQAMRAVQKNQTPVKPQQYAGEYGKITITAEGDRLFYSDEEMTKVPLHRLSNEVFDLTNLSTFRLRFHFEAGEVIAVTRHYMTGQASKYLKSGLS